MSKSDEFFCVTTPGQKLQRCENTDFAVKCFSYWRRDPQADIDWVLDVISAAGCVLSSGETASPSYE